MDNTVCTVYDIIIGICGSIIYSSSFFKSFLKNCSLQGSLGNPKSKMVPLWHCSKTPFWNLWNEDSSSASSLESIVEYNGSNLVLTHHAAHIWCRYCATLGVWLPSNLPYCYRNKFMSTPVLLNSSFNHDSSDQNV